MLLCCCAALLSPLLLLLRWLTKFVIICCLLCQRSPFAAAVVVGVANLARYNFLGLTFVLINFGLFFLCACLATLFFVAASSFALTLSRVWAEEGQRQPQRQRWLPAVVVVHKICFLPFNAPQSLLMTLPAATVLENMTKGYLSLIGFKWAGQLSNTSQPPHSLPQHALFL